MSLADIKTAQENLEEVFSKRMAELEAQLHSGGPAKDTVAKVAEEFRTFRELMFTMVGLLRRQIDECTHAIDTIETRHRRKALVFMGVQEAEKEDCKLSILNIIQKMDVPMSAAAIRDCHRLGSSSKERHRPILVWFAEVEQRAIVWRAKTKLKGTTVSLKEFLTRLRQAVFLKARQHFSMRTCWTQDGTIVVRAPDASRHKFTTIEELNLLISKYGKPTISSVASRDGAGSTGFTNGKTRK